MHKVKMEASLKFNLPEENNDFEASIYGSQLQQALKDIKIKIGYILDKQTIPDQRRQIYGEINNMILEELKVNGVTHLF